MRPDRIDIRFWPLRVMVSGERAIAALRWPLAMVLVILVLTLAVVVGLRVYVATKLRCHDLCKVEIS
ncbi:hypothetical protein [Afipia clevelandensis]|uniref:Uncharacterized protein n=1 Tax=Afipia clevelandensis ATCC 49720 TaxID=883079 RepID=K8NWM9_9BRAD|nr:hypothetical protein [Afipia clevelandensis]EKS31820.1 hypothetical protein HMPREF9696_04041 [Afipia clevelandensis ATCC 49720]